MLLRASLGNAVGMAVAGGSGWVAMGSAGTWSRKRGPARPTARTAAPPSAGRPRKAGGYGWVVPAWMVGGNSEGRRVAQQTWPGADGS